MDCDYNDLELEEACVVLSSTINFYDQDHNVTLYSLSSDCVSCPYEKVSWIPQDRNTSIRFSTAKSITWRVYNDSGIEDFRSAHEENGIICQFQPNLQEYGTYELTVDEAGCEFDAIVEPPFNPYTPLIIIFLSFFCLLSAISIVRSCVNLLRNKCGKKSVKSAQADENLANNDGVNYSTPVMPKTKNARVLSIDTFRGISILMMIFVNNGAGGYVYLEHATWDGLYVGDLVFPCFVWIMGVCIPISLSSQLARGISRLSIARRILTRSIVLFLMDLSVNSLATDSDLDKIRIFGVLQRFAVAYLIVGILYTFLSSREEKKYENDGSRVHLFSRRSFEDFLALMPQWIVILAIIVLHSGITFFLPVPGCPNGYLGPGGRHADGQFENCTGGATGYVDRTLLGVDHLYQHPTIDQVYGSGPFDPEGILGCLTTIVQTFLGVQTGKILRVHRGWKARVGRCLILVLLCGSVGSALHFTNIIPINKNLWSLSFVLVTTSLALVLFIVCYLLVDVMNIWRGGPFRIPVENVPLQISVFLRQFGAGTILLKGMNALVMYEGHRICQMFPFHWKYGNMVSHTWRTIAAAWDVTAWTIISYFLHHKKIYISI